MREVLARALSGPVSLEEREYCEMHVDRIHALASAQIKRANRAARSSLLASLGVSLIALKAANRADMYSRCVEELTRYLAWSKPVRGGSLRGAVARQAIMEFMVDFCPSCNGTGEVPAHENVDGAQRMKPCPECGGHGRRRYTDEERKEAMLLDGKDYRQAAWLMADAMGLISRAEDEAVRSARMLLERP